MKLTFDSLDEVRAFIAELDGEEDATPSTGTATTGARRGRKSAAQKAAEAAATPPTFGPPPGAAPQQGFGVPANAATGFGTPLPPQASPLVAAIIAKTEQAMTAGQPLEAVTTWFRSALGPETAQATWEQIKVAFLPKAPEATLKQIAAVVGAV